MIFNIRPATQEDAPQIKEVLQECFGFFDESMITQIKRLDFTILYENKRHNIYPYYTACNTCANKQDEHCECFEDVYIHYPEKQERKTNE